MSFLTPFIPAIISAGASLYGANRQADAQRDAANAAAEAARFRPFDVRSPFGNVTFGAAPAGGADPGGGGGGGGGVPPNTPGDIMKAQLSGLFQNSGPKPNLGGYDTPFIPLGPGPVTPQGGGTVGPNGLNNIWGGFGGMGPGGGLFGGGQIAPTTAQPGDQFFQNYDQLFGPGGLLSNPNIPGNLTGGNTTNFLPGGNPDTVNFEPNAHDQSLIDRLTGQVGAYGNALSNADYNIENMGSTAGLLARQGIGDIGGAYGGFQSALANTGVDPRLLGNQGMMSLLGQGTDINAANRGIASMFGGQSAGAAGMIQGAGADALAGLQGPDQYRDVRDQQLSLLREQAQPFEERQFNQLQQNLFNTGRLGSSGGALQTEAFARGLGQADTSRALQANQFAADLQNQGFNQYISQLGAGTTALNQSTDARSRALQGMLNAEGGFRGLLGSAGQFEGLAQGGNQTMFNNQISRAGQRMAAAESLFGFGRGVSNDLFGRMSQGAGLMSGMGQDARLMMALGGNIGGQQAAAGSSVANALLSNSGSGVGDFFANLGGSMINNGAMDPVFSRLAGLFGGGGGNP